MVTKEKWARKALHVARFKGGASTSEIGAHIGLPKLREALMEMSNFDANHRQAIVDLVLQWQDHNTAPLFNIVQAMWKAHSDEVERQQEEKI